MNKESILGIIRHILTFGGGFMTQNGIATDSEVTTGVSWQSLLWVLYGQSCLKRNNVS